MVSTVFIVILLYTYKNLDPDTPFRQRFQKAFQIAVLLSGIISGLGFSNSDIKNHNSHYDNTIITTVPIERRLSKSESKIPTNQPIKPKKIIFAKRYSNVIKSDGKMILASSSKSGGSGGDDSESWFWRTVKLIAEIVRYGSNSKSKSAVADAFTPGASPGNFGRNNRNLPTPRAAPPTVNWQGPGPGPGKGTPGGNNPGGSGGDGGSGDNPDSISKNSKKKTEKKNQKNQPKLDDGRRYDKKERVNKKDTPLSDENQKCELDDNPDKSQNQQKDELDDNLDKKKSKKISQWDVYLDEFDCIIEDSQIRKKFDNHAEDFKITAKNNRKGFELFKEKIIEHMKDPDTKRIEGTYRNKMPATYYYNEKTNVVVIIQKGDQNKFLSGWNLFPSQKRDLKENKNIN